MRAGSAPPTHGDPRAGYVLIEMVAALAVTALLLAFAFPSLSAGTSSQRFLGLVTESVALMRDARTDALARGRPVAATFDAARRTLASGSQSVTFPRDVGVALEAGGNCPATGARAQILFRPDGTNCGGILRFSRGGRIVRARVGWADGRIDVVEGG